MRSGEGLTSFDKKKNLLIFQMKKTDYHDVREKPHVKPRPGNRSRPRKPGGQWKPEVFKKRSRKSVTSFKKDLTLYKGRPKTNVFLNACFRFQ